MARKTNFNKMVFVQNGPGKFDVMLALFEGKQVYFTTDQPLESDLHTITAELAVLEAESASREGWLIKGMSQQIGGFEGYYNMRTRRGWIGWDEPTCPSCGEQNRPCAQYCRHCGESMLGA